MDGHYEKVSLKEPFYSFVDSKMPTEKGGTVVSSDELMAVGIDPNEPSGGGNASYKPYNTEVFLHPTPP